MSEVRRTAGSAFVDANVIIRYLLRDMPEATEQIRLIVEDHPRLLLTPGTIAEVCFVLTRFRKIPHALVVDTLIDLLKRENISVHLMDADLAIQALIQCRPSGRVAFADAMLWAAARSAGTSSTVYTLDRRFPSIGISVRAEY